jgi:hypothetical protein
LTHPGFAFVIKDSEMALQRRSFSPSSHYQQFLTVLDALHKDDDGPTNGDDIDDNRADDKHEAGEEDDDEEDDDDDGDDSSIKPYRNRSLAWTKRYRQLNPYEVCRKRVIRFGHRSKEDWDEAVSSGQLGAYVPSHPDEMYAPEWLSWDEWLGLIRPYNETRHLAVHVLGLKSLDQYIIFVRSDPKRAEGLRIPVRPDLRYKDEWTSEQDFFSK